MQIYASINPKSSAYGNAESRRNSEPTDRHRVRSSWRMAGGSEEDSGGLEEANGGCEGEDRDVVCCTAQRH